MNVFFLLLTNQPTVGRGYPMVKVFGRILRPLSPKLPNNSRFKDFLARIYQFHGENFALATPPQPRYMSTFYDESAVHP